MSCFSKFLATFRGSDDAKAVDSNTKLLPDDRATKGLIAVNLHNSPEIVLEPEAEFDQLTLDTAQLLVDIDHTTDKGEIIKRAQDQFHKINAYIARQIPRFTREVIERQKEELTRIQKSIKEAETALKKIIDLQVQYMAQMGEEAYQGVVQESRKNIQAMQAAHHTANERIQFNNGIVDDLHRIIAQGSQNITSLNAVLEVENLLKTIRDCALSVTSSEDIGEGYQNFTIAVFIPKIRETLELLGDTSKLLKGENPNRNAMLGETPLVSDTGEMVLTGPNETGQVLESGIEFFHKKYRNACYRTTKDFVVDPKDDY
jgi:flagellar biosynthesis chaperone FliJ